MVALIHSYYAVGFVGYSTFFISCENYMILVDYEWRCCCNLLLSTASTRLVSSIFSSIGINGILGYITLSDTTIIGTISACIVIYTLGCATIENYIGTTFMLG